MKNLDEPRADRDRFDGRPSLRRRQPSRAAARRRAAKMRETQLLVVASIRTRWSFVGCANLRDADARAFVGAAEDRIKRVSEITLPRFGTSAGRHQ
jgi:hypothetical protein